MPAPPKRNSSSRRQPMPQLAHDSRVNRPALDPQSPGHRPRRRAPLRLGHALPPLVSRPVAARPPSLAQRRHHARIHRPQIHRAPLRRRPHGPPTTQRLAHPHPTTLPPPPHSSSTLPTAPSPTLSPAHSHSTTPASTSSSSTTAAMVTAPASIPPKPPCSKTPTPHSTGFLHTTHPAAKHHPLRRRHRRLTSRSTRRRTSRHPRHRPRRTRRRPHRPRPPRPALLTRPRAPSLQPNLPTRGATLETPHTEAPHLLHERATSTRRTRQRRRPKTHHRTPLTQRSCTHPRHPTLPRSLPPDSLISDLSSLSLAP